ncbi:hypothetical protein HJFPF1_00993 [Paramyrothecium foliicola]|nr:hypothetical protein HJFPF1_00993 [Paramyrothecium foliicola]
MRPFPGDKTFYYLLGLGKASSSITEMNPSSRASAVVTARPHIPDTPSASSHVPQAPPSPTTHHPYAADYYYQYTASSDTRSPSHSQPVHVSDTPLPLRMSNPIKRKPVSNQSPLAAHNSGFSPLIPSSSELPQDADDFDHPSASQGVSIPDSSTNPRTNAPSYQLPVPNPAVAVETVTASQQSPSSNSTGTQAEDSDILSEYNDSFSDTGSVSVLDRTPATILDDHSDDAQSIKSGRNSIGTSPPMFAPKPTPLHLNLQRVEPTNADDFHFGGQIQNSLSPVLPTSPGGQRKASPKPNAPTSPFASFFGWGNQSPSVTEFSSLSSPSSPTRKGTFNEHSTSRANASTDNALGYCETNLSTPPPTNTISAAQIEEMEDELKAISSELAASIRREMDLEDLVERLQDQVNSSQIPGRRTSDYFSDSGYSSAKASEYEQSREEVDKIQRKSEQEKASIRLELTTKLQDERLQRQALDEQIKQLSERASQIDLAKINNLDANDRIKTLENTCEDLRRRLNEERDSKSNFSDLLSGLKSELSDACNERDNLRDEVVPQLRARIEGLETEAAEYSNLTYESSKMQQEIEHLKDENIALRNNTGDDIATPTTRGSRAMSGGLFRSNSIATASGRGQKPPPLTLSRSKSVKNAPIESREALAERLKDVEAQRDALHNALKNLLERQEIQNRDNEKRIRALEQERQRLILGSPRKGGFQRDIVNLRTEMNVLRRRAEDALEQKWQVEKGLIGLKMDLDRAEEEIALLRSLLKEKDILIPPSLARSSNSSDVSMSPVTSETLRTAYKELQLAYADSISRIKKLELDSSLDASDEQTQLALQRLERSLALAVSDSDEAGELTAIADSAALREVQGLNAEKALATDLADSARQVEHLAAQVRRQLSMNAELRQRLAGAVARGEADRKANSERIADLQERLRVLEEELVAAQAASEDRVTIREEEVMNLREAHNDRLHRKTRSLNMNGQKSPGLRSPRKSPMLTPMASPMFPRSPRLSPAKSFEEQAEVNVLRAKIAAMEKTLAEAENEMQDVIARMSAAQIEVLNLQEEREAAARETRRLQKIIEQEQVKAFEDRFRTLGTSS